MRRDRQMFPPRQLLHAAATRDDSASDLPKKERRREKKGRKISPSFLFSSRPTTSSRMRGVLGTRERETRGRMFLCRITIERKPGEARTRGWTAPIHKGKNVTLMSLRPWSILTISSRGRRDLTQCRQPKSEIYYSSNSLRLGSWCLYCLFIVHNSSW